MWKWLKTIFCTKIPKPLPPKPIGSSSNTCPESYATLYIKMYEVLELDLQPGQSMGLFNLMIAEIEEEKPRFEAVSDLVFEETGRRIPWQIFAVLMSMEAPLVKGEMDFSRQILNGQKWNMKTTIVPKGLGPWKSWHESCVAAVKNSSKYPDVWNVANTLYYIERYNGWGYRNKGINSPYLWSFSQWYTKGKYIRDGVYDKNAVSKQLGAAVILKYIGFKFA